CFWSIAGYNARTAPLLGSHTTRCRCTLFAHLLVVSTKFVAPWFRGNRTPSTPSMVYSFGVTDCSGRLYARFVISRKTHIRRSAHRVHDERSLRCELILGLSKCRTGTYWCVDEC